MTSLPPLIAFDLDDTLAASKSPVQPQMLALLTELLDQTEVAVISGGNFSQFQAQLLAGLDTLPEESLERMHLMPTCGTQYFRRITGEWQALYRETLDPEQRQRATEALREEAQRLGLWAEDPWGEIIEDRGSQITFSALGQRAPVSEKHEWDPDGSKKNRLREAVAARLPDLEVRSGGSTSVDITRKGIDKAYGMNKLAEATGVALSQMLFVGDRLDPEGNDYPVLAMGVPTRAVTGWEDTAAFLEAFLTANLSP